MRQLMSGSEVPLRPQRAKAPVAQTKKEKGSMIRVYGLGFSEL